MRAPRQPPLASHRSQPRTWTGRQAELMDQLEDLFLSEGFAHLTIDEIVGQLRCSKMTLYTLAPSREQLTITVLRRFFEQAVTTVDAGIEAGTSPEDRIRASVVAPAEEMRRMTPTCFNDVLQFVTTRELFEAFAASCTNRLTESLAGPGDAGSPRVKLVAEVVRLVLQDLYSGELAGRTNLDDGSALDNLVAVVIAAMAAPNGNGRPRIRRVK
jgi:AcrR family transcriptional regulator